MVKFGGLALKSIQTLLYILAFCCAAIILGIYSYFLAVLADRDIPIAAWKQAVEGIAGAAVLYLIFAIILTCFLGGVGFFALLAVVLNLLFFGAFIALAVLTRDGAESCNGFVETPIGDGPSDSGDPGYGANGFGFGEDNNSTYAPNLETACRLNRVCFAVAIIGAILFLLLTLFQLLLARHHRKEKRYGPSPSNGYTSGKTSRKFWVRKNKDKTIHDSEMGHVPNLNGTHDTVPNATTVNTATAAYTVPVVSAPGADGHHDIRPSGDTAYTGSTVAAPTSGYNKYEGTTHTPAAHAGYYSAPTGTAVNSYGYDNTARGAATNY